MDINSNFSLGLQTSYPDSYNPSVLCPIERPPRLLGMKGTDLWTAYEISWALPSGKPQVAIAELSVPCLSPFLIESKSLKLYLNSLNSYQVADWAELETLVIADLTAVAGADVEFKLFPLDSAQFLVTSLEGFCLDELPIATSTYTPTPDFLSASVKEVEETLTTHLFRSTCPVTNQPDWASIQIDYTGGQINQEGLLKYLISYRHHQGFHEHCVEMMFSDILEYCQPTSLSVYARFTRRGGLDINPFRSTHFDFPPLYPCRLPRQ